MSTLKLMRMIFWCHGIPERCLCVGSRRLPICARCTGIAVGCILGIVYVIIFPSTVSVASLFLLLPLIIDGSGQLVGLWNSTNLRRFFTGVPAGIAVICFFVYTFHSGYYIGKEARAKMLGGTKLCFVENAVKK